jgi:hypothetical protein
MVVVALIRAVWAEVRVTAAARLAVAVGPAVEG